MDKPITKKTKNALFTKGLRNKTIFAGAISLLFVSVFSFTRPSSTDGKTYNVTREGLIISQVIEDEFAEYLPVRGVVEPEKTIFIDAIDGGRVEEVYVQEGVIIEANTPILKLSNTNLQLNVLAREAEVSEQINNMRNTRLALEQNQLSLKRDVIELDFEVLRLEKRLARSDILLKKGLVSVQNHETTQDELAFQLRYRETVKESQQKEALLQDQQLKQLANSIKTLESNLAISRSSLDKLIIRAPSSGQLTFLDAEVGESKKDGQRLGQVDLIAQYKVTSQIDEFYVNRVNKGQQAEFEINGENYQLTVMKVYPGINNGTFKVDFNFPSIAAAKQLRLGQTLQLKFNLSASESKVQITNGGFMQATAGSWIFVVDASGEFAIKRQVRLGRRNPQSIEIISGLSEGERVITSSYASFVDAQRLQLSPKF